MTGKIHLLEEKTFDSFIKSGNSVVDFWAAWCGPCKIMEPHFHRAAEESKEVKFGKVDVDKEMDLAGRFHVLSIPTTIFFKDGEIVDRHTGAMSLSQIKRKLQENF